LLVLTTIKGSNESEKEASERKEKKYRDLGLQTRKFNDGRKTRNEGRKIKLRSPRGNRGPSDRNRYGRENEEETKFGEMNWIGKKKKSRFGHHTPATPSYRVRGGSMKGD